MTNKEFKQIQEGFANASKMLGQMIELKKLHAEELRLLKKPLPDPLRVVGMDFARNKNVTAEEIKNVGEKLGAAFNHGDEKIIKREPRGLKEISMTIKIICPNCRNEAIHTHNFQLNHSMTEFIHGKLTSIGHTKRLYEGSMNFNCPKCKCWHSVEMPQMEVHVHPEVTSAAFIKTVD